MASAFFLTWQTPLGIIYPVWIRIALEASIAMTLPVRSLPKDWMNTAAVAAPCFSNCGESIQKTG